MSNVTTQGAGAVGPVDGRTPDPPTLRTVHYTHLGARGKTKCILEMRLRIRSANKNNTVLIVDVDTLDKCICLDSLIGTVNMYVVRIFTYKRSRLLSSGKTKIVRLTL